MSANFMEPSNELEMLSLKAASQRSDAHAKATFVYARDLLWT